MVISEMKLFNQPEKKKNWSALASVILLLFLFSATTCEPSGARSENWAQPLKISGVPNLYKVSELLYRSAQPSAAGFKELEKLGIKTIINLRSEHSDHKNLQGTALKYYEIPSKATEVKEDHLIEFLKIVTNPEEGPYLIHCRRGADRTGLFVAVYRIVVQGWSKAEAIREMEAGGYGFNNTYTNIVKYLHTFDPEKFRQALKANENRKESQESLPVSLRPGFPEILSYFPAGS